MSQMSPVWVLILFQSVILRLADTESTPRLGSLAHLIILNCLNHQNQLWSFADVPFPYISRWPTRFCAPLNSTFFQLSNLPVSVVRYPLFMSPVSSPIPPILPH